MYKHSSSIDEGNISKGRMAYSFIVHPGLFVLVFRSCCAPSPVMELSFALSFSTSGISNAIFSPCDIQCAHYKCQRDRLRRYHPLFKCILQMAFTQHNAKKSSVNRTIGWEPRYGKMRKRSIHFPHIKLGINIV